VVHLEECGLVFPWEYEGRCAQNTTTALVLVRPEEIGLTSY